MNAAVRPKKPTFPFTLEELNLLLNNIDSCTPKEQAELLKLVEEFEVQQRLEACRNDLIEFCKAMQPDYKVGKHHRALADMLMALEQGVNGQEEAGKDRICVNMPPRHGKSQLISLYFPAWFLGRNPDKKILMVSHTTDLAETFGRKVRNLIGTEEYAEIFPGTKLAIDNKAARRWNTSVGGEYFACGVGSALAGRGAHLLIVDDPHNEQDIINGNLDVFDKAYEWFTYGARTRLMPGGRVAICQCMTGDTGVLLPNGTEKPLRDIRPGDSVASYKDGRLVARKVLNWQLSGLDSIYTIKTTCGKVVQANARHPFLVWHPEGTTTWVRLKHLKPGDFLVSLKDAPTLARQKPGQASATPVVPEPATIAKTQTRNTAPSGIGVSMPGSNAGPKTAPTQRQIKELMGTVSFATQSTIGLMRLKAGIQQRITAIGTSSIAMVYRLKTIIGCWMHKVGSVLFVNNHRPVTTPGRTGGTSCAWTTVTLKEKSGHSYVTTVTSQRVIPKHLRSPELWPTTSTFIPTQIESITAAGTEEVFDIQVEETENFIANSIVSHNTRWHMDDLTGRLVRDMAQNELADKYEVVEFPAIFEIEQQVTAPSDPDDPDSPTTTTTRIIEKALWPEFYDLPALHRTKASMPLFQWNAQYQQNPTAEEAAVVKREWWNLWPHEDPPKCEYLIMSLDAAAETGNRADFTAISVWGVFMYEDTIRDNAGDVVGVPNTFNIILLDCVRKRLEFPELKDEAMQLYRQWEPDAFIVEKKGSGTPLYQELRRSGLLVQEYTPHRGSGDKMARLNSVADIIRSRMVWVPQTRWAEELVEEVAGFPFMSHDDLVDSTVMALMRFRQGGFLRLPSDEPEEQRYYRRRKEGYY